MRIGILGPLEVRDETGRAVPIGGGGTDRKIAGLGPGFSRTATRPWMNEGHITDFGHGNQDETDVIMTEIRDMWRRGGTGGRQWRASGPGQA